MTALLDAARQALEALERCAMTIDWEWGDCRELEEMRQTGQYTDETTPAITALRQAIEQAERKNPSAGDAELYARKLREWREHDKALFTNTPQPGRHAVKNLADYEFKTYKTGGAELEAGFYSTDELRDLVKLLDKMNAVTERKMRKMK